MDPDELNRSASHPTGMSQRDGDVALAIERITVGFIRHLVQGHPPGGLRMLRRRRNVAFSDEDGALVHDTGTICVPFEARTMQRMGRVFAIMAHCHHLLIHGGTTNQRALYYSLVHLFPSQRQCTASVADVCAALGGVPRHHLRVGTATRGVVAGCIRIVSSENSDVEIDCRYTALDGSPIPGNMDEVQALRFVVHARCLLIVEKLGVFTRLAQDRVWAHLPCVMICGRGYPSMATRAFAKRIQEQAKIPAYALTDCNAHGIQIWLTYRQGGVSNYEGRRHVIDVAWLGLRPSQVRQHADRLDMEMHPEPQSANDEGIMRGVRARLDGLAKHEADEIKLELDALAETGKHELQWLFAHPQGLHYIARTFIAHEIHVADARHARTEA